MPDRSGNSSQEPNSPAGGSPDSASPDGLILVGRVLAPWGLRGEMRVHVVSSNPARFQRGARLYLNGEPHTIITSRPGQKGQVVLLLDGITSPESAGAFRGAELQAPEEEAPPLNEGWYYHFQLLGLSVVTDQGRELGTLVQIMETGANDVYIVRDGTREHLIPAIADVVLDVDLDAKRMTIHPIEGLLD